MVKFRKLPDNFAELVPVTIFDTEDWGAEKLLQMFLSGICDVPNA